MSVEIKIDNKLDLVFERVTSIPAEKIWKAWTHPETLKKWFCPKPWKVTDCRIDPYPGGEFFTRMEGPLGQPIPSAGCVLEAVENQKLITTNMMTKGYYPLSSDVVKFSYVIKIQLSKTDKGTLYRVIISHADEEGRKKHEQMGFQQGWGVAFDQLSELVKNQEL